MIFSITNGGMAPDGVTIVMVFLADGTPRDQIISSAEIQKITSDPSAVSWRADTIDIVVRGYSGIFNTSQIWRKSWSGGRWFNWAQTRLHSKSVINGTPAVSSWGLGRLDI